MASDGRRPFTGFRFAVELAVPGVADALCSAAFSECSGLEQSMEPKTLREGGNNARQHHLVGPVGYGQLSLKRGMTSDIGLWSWFEAVLQDARLRSDADIVLLDPADGSERLRFRVERCLPISLRAPGLDATSSAVLIEELQIAYEKLQLIAPGGGGFGLSASLGVSASFGASASFDAGASFGASASVGASAGLSASASVGASASVSAGASVSLGGGASIRIG